MDVRWPFIRQGPVMASSTTLGDYAPRGALHFTDPQFPPCNSCGEGAVYANIDGTTAGGGFDMQLIGDTEWKSRDAWLDTVRRAGIDDEKLPTDGYSCPLRQFDNLPTTS
ncbi:hypothetical protein AWV80_23360 [Cupriavidus sp. UYMU48A]|nr:hypothetical protein AWV80_23360 [Cupriavidus sp. UYMU48A]